MKYVFLLIWKVILIVFWILLVLLYPIIAILKFIWDFKIEAWDKYTPIYKRELDPYSGSKFHIFYKRYNKTPIEDLKQILGIKEEK